MRDMAPAHHLYSMGRHYDWAMTRGNAVSCPVHCFKFWRMDRDRYERLISPLQVAAGITSYALLSEWEPLK